MSVYQAVLPFVLFVATVVLWVSAVTYTNMFFERLAQKHTATWVKLGGPPYDRRWQTSGMMIVLPYLYKRRYHKFMDRELDRIGDVLIRVHVAGNFLALLFFISLLNLMR